MKKLSLILILALCLVVAMLAACTNEGTTTTDTDAPAETWICECGQDNGGKFCSECGTARPEPETTEAETEAPSEEATEETTAETTAAATEEVTEPAETAFVAGQGTPVTAETVFDENATVYAHWRLPGDLDGDGKVTMADVTLLAKYVKARGQGVEIVPGSGNVDGGVDGKITTADVALLAKYVKARGEGVEIH